MSCDTGFRKHLICYPYLHAYKIKYWFKIFCSYQIESKCNQLQLANALKTSLNLFKLHYNNKANLRDLIAATGLVTWFGLCDLEIRPMALKNNRDLLSCPFQLCVSFHSHQYICLGLTVWICSTQVKTGILLSPMTTKLDRWHLKTIAHLSYASFSFMHHYVMVISEFKFELQSRNAQIRSILVIFCILWPWNFTDDLQKQ